MTRRLLIALGTGVLLGAFGLLLSFLQLAQSIEEDIGLGALFKMRGARKAPADALVVSIDNESSEELKIPDDPDRWPRSLHARLIRKLVAQGAAVISFDVFFIEPKSQADDNALVSAVRQAGNVVLCEPLVAKEVSAGAPQDADAPEHSIVRIVKPFGALAQSAAITAPFVLPRIPFKVNQYWAFQTAAGDAPTMPMAALQMLTLPVYEEFIALVARADPAAAAKLPQHPSAAIEGRALYRTMTQIRAQFESDRALGPGVRLAFERMDPSKMSAQRYRWLRALVDLYTGPNRRYVNYYGPPRTILTIPYHQALQLGENTGAPAVDLKGKVVFVGLSEKLLAERKDSFYTVFAQANGVFVGGVEIAATAMLNLLERVTVTPVSAVTRLALFLAWSVLLVVVCRMLHAGYAALFVAAAAAAYVLHADYVFSHSARWYPMVIPLFVQAPLAFFGVLFWNYSEVSRERRHMRTVLAHYVPDELVDQLARNQIDMKSGGQSVYGAVLFADIAGYTTLSEKMSPQELRDLMHRYFEAAFAPVKKHGGLICNLKGDCFLAIWKATRSEAAMRRSVCAAAIEVGAAIRRFNASLPELKLPTRVGVHCGELYIGNVGAGEHYEYGPTGDVVNTASRMDSLNKYLGTEVLASGELLAGLDEFAAREVGAFRLKGKTQPVVVHELIAQASQAGAEQVSRRAQFAEALAAFRAQSWETAAGKFKELVLRDGDGPAYYYLQLCSEYQKSPPDPAWDAVVPLSEK